MAEKRRASGRTRDAKRRRTSVKATTPKAATPVVEEAAVVEEPVRESTPLPNKVVESRPLPTLSEPQSTQLPDDEFRSIAESGVLLASLERSRQKWLSGSFLEKYWTKTSGRKDAPPPPPGNPHKSWMKEIGPCTIVVEPLVLEATAFYVKEPGPPPPAVAYASPQQPPPQQHFQHQPYHHQPYQHTPQQQRPPSAPMQNSPAGSPYGAPYSTPSAHYQNRPQNYSPSAHQPTPDHRPLPPIMPATARAPPPPQPAAPAKQSPDPVIQMLASRASSDPELKALMKIVATGNANQEQLRIFQRHIDELTAMINANKAQASNHAPSPAPAYSHPPSRPPSTAPPMIQPHPGTPTHRPPIYPMPQHVQHPQYQHQNAPPPRYPSYPIVLEFQGQGASPDRFRFPENAILEFLTPYTMLASFLVIRKGSAIGPHLDAETEYYEPVTVRMGVSEGRSAARDVLQFINRSVKPADQVRAWMTEKIEKGMRAQRRYLALRLPHKSGIIEVEEEIPVVQEVKPKPKPAPRKKKEEKDNDQGGNKEAEKGQEQGNKQEGSTGAPTTATQQAPPQDTQAASANVPNAAAGNAQEGVKEVEPPVAAPANTEGSEQVPAQPTETPAADNTPAPRKKSVRISEIPDTTSSSNGEINAVPDAIAGAIAPTPS